MKRLPPSLHGAERAQKRQLASQSYRINVLRGQV